MKDQTFLGVFLTLIGVIGVIVGLVKDQFSSNPILYVAPVILGVLMIVIDQVAKRRK